jgi:hypothetical protein
MRCSVQSKSHIMSVTWSVVRKWRCYSVVAQSVINLGGLIFFGHIYVVSSIEETSRKCFGLVLSTRDFCLSKTDFIFLFYTSFVYCLYLFFISLISHIEICKYLVEISDIIQYQRWLYADWCWFEVLNIGEKEFWAFQKWCPDITPVCSMWYFWTQKKLERLWTYDIQCFKVSLRMNDGRPRTFQFRSPITIKSR